MIDELMSDDLDFSTPDSSLDFAEQTCEPGEDGFLGATITPDVNYPGTGFILREGRDFISTITKSNVTQGGWDVQRYGSDCAAPMDMGSVLDSFDFSMDDVRTPWSKNPDLAADGVVGTPDIDQGYWEQQTTAFTCAVEAQRGIIEQFTGQPVSEAQLTYEATANGWLTDRGMSPADAGNLLELHGIDCHSMTGASVEDLMAELAQGHKVIVGVDSGEIWRNDFPLEDFFHQSADHAIWVTGVDMTDPANPKVIVNDSGDPNGAGKVYDMHDFADAWQDSGFFYVATDDAPSDMSFAAGRGFDTESGVFPELASYFGHLYADFQNHLQDRLGDPTPIKPSETLVVFNDAAVRSIIENLPQSPMASFNESATDTLFRIL